MSETTTVTKEQTDAINGFAGQLLGQLSSIFGKPENRKQISAVLKQGDLIGSLLGPKAALFVDLTRTAMDTDFADLKKEGMRGEQGVNLIGNATNTVTTQFGMRLANKYIDNPHLANLAGGMLGKLIGDQARGILSKRFNLEILSPAEKTKQENAKKEAEKEAEMEEKIRAKIAQEKAEKKAKKKAKKQQKKIEELEAKLAEKDNEKVNSESTEKTTDTPVAAADDPQESSVEGEEIVKDESPQEMSNDELAKALEGSGITISKEEQQKEKVKTALNFDQLADAERAEEKAEKKEKKVHIPKVGTLNEDVVKAAMAIQEKKLTAHKPEETKDIDFGSIKEADKQTGFKKVIGVEGFSPN